MKRLPCLMVMILVVILSVTGCYIYESHKNGDFAKHTVTTQTDKPTDKTVATSGREKQEIENSDSSIKKPSEAAPGPTTGTANTVTLMITKDFGKQVLLKKHAAIDKNSTVIDALKANIDVITRYDGNYVSSIKGLESHNGGISGENLDWFYYINGICSDAGVGDYNLKTGETIWWDYHKWKSTGFVNSAVIGCYPEPFTHGYRGRVGATTIMSSTENVKLANAIDKALKAKGVSSINIVGMNNNLLEKRTNPTIVIGTWSELRNLAWLDKFNNAYRKTGTSIHFTDSSLELLDFGGNSARTINGSAGIIVAAGSGLGDENPLWIIGGTDQAGVQQAVELLAQNPGRISGLYSAAVSAGEIIRLPLQ